jgi:hypothetical protein
VVLHRECRILNRRGPHVLYRDANGTHWLCPRDNFDGEASPGVARFALLS